MAWPRIDFIFQLQIYRCHTKWCRAVSEYKQIPQMYFDIGVGTYDLTKANDATG